MTHQHIVAILILLSISSCGNQAAVNALIAQANLDNRKAFAEAMTRAATTPSSVDDVAIAMYFSGNTGQQQFQREDTALDYARVFLPYVTGFIPLLYNNDGDSTGTVTSGRDTYINSTRSGSVGVDIFGVDSGISYGADASVPGYACDGCSWNSMMEGSCTCF